MFFEPLNAPRSTTTTSTPAFANAYAAAQPARPPPHDHDVEYFLIHRAKLLLFPNAITSRHFSTSRATAQA